MDTVARLGIKKSKAILLFVQMLLTIVLFVTAVYLLLFVITLNLGGWMIASYCFIIVSVGAIAIYGAIGYKKGEGAYMLSIVPFLGAILINILLPQRNAFQIGLLSVLLALVAVFLAKQKDLKFNSIISDAMVAVSLIFSVYSAVTARLDFLGQLSAKWYTYLAMYLSIFVPTVMSGTFALTYNVRMTRIAAKKK